jgi:exopolysaccharide biosynthesis polyprenyl glycosylphosphotransferase
MLWRSSLNQKIAMLGDTVTVFISFALSFLIWRLLRNTFQSPFLGGLVDPSLQYYVLAIISALLWTRLMTGQGAYAYQRFTSYETELKTIFRVTLVGVGLLLAFTFFSRTLYIPRSLVVIFALVNLMSLAAEKALVFYVAKVFRAQGRDRRTVLLVGNESDVKRFVAAIHEHFGWGLEITGIVTSEATDNTTILGAPVVGNYGQFSDALHQYCVDEVIVVTGRASFNELGPVLSACELEGVAVKMVSDILGRRARQIRADVVYDMPIVSIEWHGHEQWQLTVKRALDIIVSATALIILAPILLIIVIAIKLTSPGPVFYQWRVVGKNKRPFTGYKFRTMVVNADAIKKDLMHQNEMTGPVFKLKNDPRITPIGHYLRKFSLDELPQLYSVLKGDMSLVGPRPPLVTEFNEFDPWHRRKLSIKPGITCLWQVNGRNDIADFDNWARLDLEYIDSWSLWLDFKILIKTVPTVLLGRGR